MATKSKQESDRKWYKSLTKEQMRERANRSALWKANNPGVAEKNRDERKIRVLTHYGKDKNLQCCWEGCTVCDPDMLSLDHINNDGAKDRIRGTGNNLYLSVEREGYPDNFQTLCHNHQWKKEILRRRELRIKV